MRAIPVPNQIASYRVLPTVSTVFVAVESALDCQKRYCGSQLSQKEMRVNVRDGVEIARRSHRAAYCDPHRHRLTSQPGGVVVPSTTIS
jgi:hypothetical protein